MKELIEKIRLHFVKPAIINIYRDNKTQIPNLNLFYRATATRMTSDLPWKTVWHNLDKLSLVELQEILSTLDGIKQRMPEDEKIIRKTTNIWDFHMVKVDRPIVPDTLVRPGLLHKDVNLPDGRTVSLRQHRAAEFRDFLEYYFDEAHEYEHLL